MNAGRYRFEPYLAARTLVEDLRPVVEVAQRAGVPLVAHAFVGSSPIRVWAEGWDARELCRRVARAVGFAVREGLPVAFVTEDTTRSSPELLAPLFRAALDAGASRLVLCDTVGHATPEGARALVRWAKAQLAGLGRTGDVALEWHGHNDRGLALPAALAALEAGAGRAHGCGLGLGERVGNAPLELLLLNLRLLGWLPEGHELTGLVPYVGAVSRVLGVPVPRNYPLAGADAFRTATGVHAAALRKAHARGGAALADRVYSAVPAGDFGRVQDIEVGPMSGRANVHAWLERQGLPASEALTRALLAAAKRARGVLGDAELWAVCREAGVRPPRRRG